eukprot:IDg14527t1
MSRKRSNGAFPHASTKVSTAIPLPSDHFPAPAGLSFSGRSARKTGGCSSSLRAQRVQAMQTLERRWVSTCIHTQAWTQLRVPHVDAHTRERKRITVRSPHNSGFAGFAQKERKKSANSSSFTPRCAGILGASASHATFWRGAWQTH